MSGGAAILSGLALALVRLVLGSVFLASAWAKIRQPQSFAAAVAEYHILPRRLVQPFSLCLPWAEGMAAFLLLLGWQTVAAAWLTCLLLGMFTLAMGVNLLRGRVDLDCGCFGHDRGHHISWRLLLRDVLLAMLSLVLIANGGGRIALDSWLSTVRGSAARAFLAEAALPLALTGVGVAVLASLVRRLVLFLQLGGDL